MISVRITRFLVSGGSSARMLNSSISITSGLVLGSESIRRKTTIFAHPFENISLDCRAPASPAGTRPEPLGVFTREVWLQRARHIFFGIALIALPCGCAQKNPPPVSDREKAVADLRAQLTNDVVGLSKIISLNLNERGRYVTNWKAAATVEFVNPQGGIQRTDIYYRCVSENYWVRDSEESYNWKPVL